MDNEGDEWHGVVDSNEEGDNPAEHRGYRQAKQCRWLWRGGDKLARYVVEPSFQHSIGILALNSAPLERITQTLVSILYSSKLSG